MSFPDFLLEQVKSLLRDGLFDSADLMLQCYVHKENIPNEWIFIYAKTLMKKEEYFRAIHHFQQILNNPLVEKQFTKEKIIIYITKCYRKLSQPLEALQTLQSIPEKQRSIKILLLMANLFRVLKQSRYARNLYIEILKRNPLAIEAAIALTQLGCDPNQIVKFTELRNLVAKNVIPLPVAKANQDVVQQLCLHNESLVRAHAFANQSKFPEALNQFSYIQSNYQKHLHSLQHIALCNARMSNFDKAKYSFELLRSCDPRYVSSMDVYGSIIKSEGKVMELNKLTHELLEVDRFRPECWVVMSLYCELKGLKSDAGMFIEKATSLAAGKLSDVYSVVIRGELQLALKRPAQALDSFLQAYAIEKDISVYHGLVHSCIELRKFEEALRYAKEIWEKQPNNPQSWTIFGTVLMNTPVENGRVKARKCLEKALELDEYCFEAVMTLVDINIADEKLDDAIKLLNKQKDHEHKRLAWVFAKLGDIAVIANNFAEAMIYYHNALQINQHLQTAKDGLEVLEKQLNRLKADNSENEDEEEDEDEEDVFSASGSELDESFDTFI